MDLLKIPVDPKLPILLCGTPLLRFAMVALIVGFVHAVISWLPPVSGMCFGFAAVDDNRLYKTLSKVCFGAYYFWNFGYYLLRPGEWWQPRMASHGLIILAWSGVVGLMIGWLDGARCRRVIREMTSAPSSSRPAEAV